MALHVVKQPTILGPTEQNFTVTQLSTSHYHILASQAI